jgi:hypothetical protein
MSWLRIRSEEKHNGNGTYINLENSSRIGVQEYQHRDSTPRWRVWYGGYQQVAQTLGDGYLSEADALAALDALMSEFEFIELTPPITAEEKAEAAAVESTEGEEVK